MKYLWYVPAAVLIAGFSLFTCCCGARRFKDPPFFRLNIKIIPENQLQQNNFYNATPILLMVSCSVTFIIFNDLQTKKK